MDQLMHNLSCHCEGGTQICQHWTLENWLTCCADQNLVNFSTDDPHELDSNLWLISSRPIPYMQINNTWLSSRWAQPEHWYQLPNEIHFYGITRWHHIIKTNHSGSQRSLSIPNNLHAFSSCWPFPPASHTLNDWTPEEIIRVRWLQLMAKSSVYKNNSFS